MTNAGVLVLGSEFGYDPFENNMFLPVRPYYTLLESLYPQCTLVFYGESTVLVLSFVMIFGSLLYDRKRREIIYRVFLIPHLSLHVRVLFGLTDTIHSTAVLKNSSDHRT